MAVSHLCVLVLGGRIITESLRRDVSAEYESVSVSTQVLVCVCVCVCVCEASWGNNGGLVGSVRVFSMKAVKRRPCV